MRDCGATAAPTPTARCCWTPPCASEPPALPAPSPCLPLPAGEGKEGAAPVALSLRERAGAGAKGNAAETLRAPDESLAR
ncbi:MAG: hypothetical protein OXU61_09120 [Gammaproteobacteria bacterium]|nr:hypothetical protein [Gammaproteobacteria bacterium]